MKIVNLIVLSIAIMLGMLYGPTEDRDGSVTFTDHLSRSVTISRFGSVLSLKNKNGEEFVPPNVYRVCPCGEKEPCIESATLSKDTIAKLEVEFPKKGTTLERGQTLVVTATFRQGDLTVSRRLTWKAGSGSVISEETITGPRTLCVCTFNPEPKRVTLAEKMCAGPPGRWPCPPLVESQPSDTQSVAATIEYRIPGK